MPPVKLDRSHPLSIQLDAHMELGATQVLGLAKTLKVSFIGACTDALPTLLCTRVLSSGMGELPNGPKEATEATLASVLGDVLSPISLPCSGRTMSNKLVKVPFPALDNILSY